MTLPGDINGDGCVDQLDLDILVAHFGQTVPAGTLGDLNGDGAIDLQDFGILKDNWGAGVPVEPWAAAAYADYTADVFVGEPTYSDVRQGMLGNCQMLAGLAALANDRPDALASAFIDEGDAVTVRLYTSKSTKHVRVTKRFPTYSGSPIYAKTAQDGALWVPAFEKSIAVYMGGDYRKATQIWARGVWQMLCGCETYELPLYDKTDDALPGVFANASGKPATAITRMDAPDLVRNHAYAVLSSDGNSIELYNPWARDGLTGSGDPNDGLVTVEYDRVHANIQYLEIGEC